MPFGLFNAQACFQDYINKILAKKLEVFIIFYLDDILIYIEDKSQNHVNNVRWALNKVKKPGLFANLKNCQFYKDKVQFLDYVVSVQRVRIEDEKIKAMKNWFEPKSIKNIQGFLGFANFHQRFIWSFNRIARPLISMLKSSFVTKLSKNLLL